MRRVASAIPPELGLLRFMEYHPTPIEVADPNSLRVRSRARRIEWKTSRIQREWRRKHGGMKRELALHFALAELANLHPRRDGETYTFVYFGLRGPLPKPRALSEWCTAYALCDRETA